MDAVPDSVLVAARASFAMRRPGTVGLSLAWERRYPGRPDGRRTRALRCFANDDVRVFVDVCSGDGRFDLYVSVDPPQYVQAELLHVPGSVSLLSDDPPPIPFLALPDGWVSLLLRPVGGGSDDVTLQTAWTKL